MLSRISKINTFVEISNLHLKLKRAKVQNNGWIVVFSQQPLICCRSDIMFHVNAVLIDQQIFSKTVDR